MAPHSRDLYEPEQPHFVTAIISYEHQLHRLAIPKRFINLYGEDLSECLTLNVPNGESWSVNVASFDGRIHLLNGWREFVEHYSVVEGNILIFKYKSDSVFEVSILASNDDLSLVEIEYPVRSTSHVSMYSEEETSTFSLEVQGGSTSKTKKTYKSNPQGQVPKRLQAGKRSVARQTSRNPRPEIPIRTQPLEVARRFCSKNPFFQIQIGPSIVMRSSVTVGGKFMDKAHLKKKEQIMNFKLGEYTWPVKLHYYPRLNRGKLCGGWMAFVREAKLRQGDICIFEFIRRKDLLVNVSVFRRGS